jgi:hypothetical protein
MAAGVQPAERRFGKIDSDTAPAALRRAARWPGGGKFTFGELARHGSFPVLQRQIR